MKNKMFEHLLERFKNAGNIKGKRTANENEWYYNVIDALTDVSQVIDNQDTVDNEKAAEAFKKLKVARENFMTHVNTNEIKKIPRAVRPLIAPMLALQTPLECYTKNLENGQSLKAALSDSAWIDNLFPDLKEAEIDKNYVPGKFRSDKQNFQDTLEAYGDESDKVGRTFDEFMQNISMSEKRSNPVLQEKITLMQEFVDSFEDAPEAENQRTTKPDFKKYIGGYYTELEKRFNPKNIDSLGNSYHIMSKDFFDESKYPSFDINVIKGNVEGMKTLSDDAKKRLVNAVTKLKPTAAKIGITPDQIERLEAYSIGFRTLSAAVKAAKDAFSKYKDPNHDNIFNLFDNMLQSAQDYLQEKGDLQVEGNLDKSYLLDIAKEVEQQFISRSIFNYFGEFDSQTEKFSAIYKAMAQCFPDIAADLQPTIESFEKNVELATLKKQETEKEMVQNQSPVQADEGNLKKVSEEKVVQNQSPVQADEGNIKNVSEENVVNRDLEIKTTIIKMARDQAYNRIIVEGTEKAFGEFADNMKKDPGSCSLEVLSKNRRRNAQALYQDAYTLYFLGKQLETERQKIAIQNDPNASFVEKMKNTPNPALQKLMTGDTVDEESITIAGNAIQKLQERSSYVSLIKGKNDGPAVMNQVLNDPNSKKLEKLLTSVTGPKLNYLKGTGDDTLSILTQTKGFANQQNSQSYEEMSEALKDIYKKNATDEGAKKDDYEALYDASKKYALCHDSNPFTNNGKKREAAAMNMMRKLGQKLANNDKRFARQYQTDHAINMARSSEYRKVAVNDAKKQILKLIQENQDSFNGHASIPGDVQEKLDEHYRNICIAESLDKALKYEFGNEIRGKYTDATVEKKINSSLSQIQETVANEMEVYRSNRQFVLREKDPQFAPYILSKSKQATQQVAPQNIQSSK